MDNTHVPVVIAGGGPVGLFLALCLRRRGVSCLVAEKREEAITHSRSLGIHPVSLERFDELGVADRFLEEGIRIRRGVARSGRRRLGTVSFESCPPPFNFILSLPQYRTERLLEESLRERRPGTLRRGLRVTGFREESGGVRVETLEGGREGELSCDYLVGCDGKESGVRRRAGFDFKGNPYGKSYLMGDFDDHTGFGADAVVFLCREGLVESFPLPPRRRRWVVGTESYLEQPDRKVLEEAVQRRTGHELEGVKNHMLSSFGVQRYIARPMARGRVLLAGDAAQVVSPIGGQGMNLGWLQAWELAGAIETVLQHPDSRERSFRSYDRGRRRTARKAIRRAEFNMRLGSKSVLAPLRNLMVSVALHTPLSRYLARVFTMRDF